MGAIGGEEAATATPDRYTLFMACVIANGGDGS
jgi:hypothetical protein